MGFVFFRVISWIVPVREKRRRSTKSHESNTNKIHDSGQILVLKQPNTNGGIRSGKLLSSPRPHYPKGLGQKRASGRVTVKVLIDEKEAVLNACATSGDPIFWPYAESAAYQARLEPTTLMGIPIRIPGILPFDFRK